MFGGTTMNLNELLTNVDVIHHRNLDDINVDFITDDSREVKPGSMFVAVRGYEHDGHVYIDEAIQNGASVIVGEKDLELLVPYVQVRNSKKALGQILCQYYKQPSACKKVIGVTGTNGKTTTSYMLKAIFEQNNYSVGIIGTIEYFINGESRPSQNTTPGTAMLQKLLYESVDDVIIIEISSHALKQCRVEGVQLDAAIFTNLDSEHLDYHKSMTEYFESKFKIFDLLKPHGYALVNRDDEWGEKAYHLLREKGTHVYTVGTSSKADAQIHRQDTSVTLKAINTNVLLNLKMPGIHNRFNAAFSLMVGELFDLELSETVDALNHVEKVKGRFEVVNFPGNITVVVDYAHTPKGFYHCLNAVRESGANRIIHVFGFRGSRYSTKREVMMNESLKVSDYYILTFDDLNGSTEEEMRQILKYFHDHHGSSKGEVIPDRTIAIERAIKLANDGDWIIITGKGHEQYKGNFALGTKTDLETVETLMNRARQITRLS